MLLIIVGNQIFWIVNMYSSYQQELVLEIDRAIESAVYVEMTERNDDGGGFYSYRLYAGETERFIQREIEAVDTTYVVTIDRQDPNANLKIMQFVLKDDIPLNLDRLNQIFQEQLQTSHFPITSTYIEYFDLENNRLLDSNEPDFNLASYTSSSLIPIDIMESIGVKAYVESSMLTILERMIFQLSLSILLICITVLGLFMLGRTIYMQWRLEKMQQDSINSMTHEFKRPISTAVSLISLIPYYVEKGRPEKVVTYAEDTLQELNKLTAYTEQIQQISNNNVATIHLSVAQIAIKPFFERLRNEYQTLLEDGTVAEGAKKKVDIRLSVDTARPYLQADLLHFTNVMENLIENAIKYSGESVTIDLSVTDREDWLCIAVSDNGIGISPLDKRYIFNKYYRGKSEGTSRQTGFGLGLTYVKTVIDAHNGRIELNSLLGKGSEFILLLPN